MKINTNNYQVLVRFQESGRFKCKDDVIGRLGDFINYDALIAKDNPIDAINVEISSYCFDHEQVREAMYKFIDAINASLNVRCSLSLVNITESSKDLVGRMANKPIRDVSYIIEIRRNTEV